jgi:Leucine-rich repeat (LRR) protein
MSQFSIYISTGPPQQNCSINGSVYSSDKQVIQSFPFQVSINPSPPLPSPPTFSYAQVDTDGHVIELTLVNINIVPSALFCLSQLQALSILKCAQLSIPPEIVRFAPSLKSFTVSNTASSLILPSEFFNMTGLSTLSLVNCGLETLSEDIVKLTQLTQLTLDQNQLMTLPPTLGKMSSLTSLSIGANPRLFSLDALNGLSSLTILRAWSCLIDHLPTNISKLRVIDMTGNQLTSLNGLETLTSIFSNSLSFGNNRIASIPTAFLKNIQTLSSFDLHNNLLTTLPDSIYRVKDLEELDIHNNNFEAKEKEWIQGIFRLTNTTVII